MTRSPRLSITAAAAPAFVLVPLLALALPAAAQESSEAWLQECRDGRMNRDRVTHCELRESTIAAPSRLTVDAAPNGGVRVRGGSRSDVHVVARVQSWAANEADARELASEVQIESSGGTLRANGPRVRGEDNRGWSVTYIVQVPGGIDLDLSTVNGGIDVSDVAGALELRTTNGSIDLAAVGGDVQARTTNGAIEASLVGDAWKGEALELETTNGSISLRVPEGFAADLHARTVHGGIDTDFPVTVQGRIGRSVDARIGGGGPPVRLATTNGGIEIRRR